MRNQHRDATSPYRKSQLRWFGHVSKIPSERLTKRTLYAKSIEKRPVGRPKKCLDNINDCGWYRSRLRSEMQSVLVDREVWRLNLELLPPQLSSKTG